MQRSLLAQLSPWRLPQCRGFATTPLVNSAQAAPAFPFKRPRAADPPSEYKEIRARKCPVAKVRLWDNTEPWLITTHKGVSEVLKDERFSKQRTLPNFPEMSPGGKEAAKQRPTFVDMDRPEHTKYRGLVEHVFTKEHVESLRPAIQKTVNECLDQMIAKGAPANLLDFAMNVPMFVICDMLGIPRADVPKLINYAAVRGTGSSTATQAAQASQDLVNYCADLVKKKKATGGSDLVCDLLAQNKKGMISEEDIAATAFLLLVAGNATVCSEIALGVISLLQHPDQLAAMKSDPKLVPKAVEEICRYHTASAYALRRVAKVDVTVDGQLIKAGEGIIASNQSANRDEKVFRNPDAFDITRDPNPELGFGTGIHECVAEWLARAEMQVALETLFKRLPNLKIAVPFDQIKYSDPDKDVGLVELPVTW